MSRTGLPIAEKGRATKVALVRFCPRYLKAVELVGRRWSGAILRALMSGPMRFNEIVEAVPGLSDRLLAARLKELEECGVVKRTVATESPVRVAYALTKAGTELDGAVRAIAAWAERWIPVR